MSELPPLVIPISPSGLAEAPPVSGKGLPTVPPVKSAWEIEATSPLNPHLGFWNSKDMDKIAERESAKNQARAEQMLEVLEFFGV